MFPTMIITIKKGIYDKYKIDHMSVIQGCNKKVWDKTCINHASTR